MSLFDDVKKNLVEWYSISSEKTAEVAKVTTRRYDKFGISRDIERQFGELGSLVYNGVREEREDLLTDPAVLALISRIQGLEEELRLKNEEIEGIQSEYSERRARAASAGAGAAGTAEETGQGAESAPVTETVLKQPILDAGSEESAILVEPVVVDVEESEVASAPVGENEEESHPEKDA
jgi:hypothetical protein